jgi:hypothetical protein
MGERLEVIDELERRLIESCYRRPDWRERLRSPRTWVPATGLAAAIVIASVVAVVPGGEVSPSPAQAALRSAARAAAQAPPTALMAGREWYVRAVITAEEPLPVIPRTGGLPANPFANTVDVISRTEIRSWVTRAGQEHSRDRTSLAFASRSGAARYGRRLQRLQTSRSRRDGHGLLGSPLGPPRLMSYRQLRALPTAVPALLRTIRRLQARLRAGVAPNGPQTPTTPSGPITSIGPATSTAPVMPTTPQRPAAGPQAPAVTPSTPQAPFITPTNPNVTTSTVVDNGTTSEVLSATMTGTVVGRCCGSSPVARSAVGELNVIAWLLAMPVSAAVRAALYRTAASLPGVRYEGTARDALGRHGTEIAIGSGEDQMRMIFDPHSGALLASSMSFGASALSKGFGPLLETIAVEKVVKIPRP